jgi:hypothetical protein
LKPFLTGNEIESRAEFEQKIFQFAQDGVFKIFSR